MSTPNKKRRVITTEIQHSNLSNYSVFNPLGGGNAPSINVFRDIVLRGLDKVKVKIPEMQHLEKGIEQLCN